MTSRSWVVMCSGSPWDAAAHRQQALAHEVALEHDVLFCDPPGNRPRAAGVIRVAPQVWRLQPAVCAPGGRHVAAIDVVNRTLTARAVNRFLAAHGADRRVLWLDEDLAAALVGRCGEAAVVYDAVDLDWTFTRPWNRRRLRAALRRSVSSADLVLASSAALPERLPAGRGHRAAVVIPNGCDPQHFDPSGPVWPPAANLAGPVLGYLGALDTRAFDAALIATVARRRPQWTFLLVGPRTAAGTAPLAGLGNVRILDPVAFGDAPAVLRACDVGLIPYRVGEDIDYVHPKKLYEYLAMGLPVVATALPALRALAQDADLLRVCRDGDEFMAAIAAALAGPTGPEVVARRRAVAERNTWAQRGVDVRAALRTVGAGVAA